MKRLFLATLLLFAHLAPSRAQEAVASLPGLWLTEDQDAVIEFFPCDNQSYCGRFVWLKDDSAQSPSLDDKNPDPDKAKRPLCGLTFLGGFAPTEQGRLTSGWIYSPRHGAMFSAEIALLDPQTLELRGYMFVPFLGGSQVWKRTEKSDRCPALVGDSSP